jgi:lantibiotic leader peptide-processing serine protease
MSKVLGRSLSFAAVSLVVASVLGCSAGADPSGAETETETEIASGALVAGQSFVVSFSGGGIPANASSLVRSAGGTIVARYNAVGAVLARSASGSFAATLRATPGIDAVGNAAAVHSSIAPVIMKTVTRPPHKHSPSAAGDPLSFRQWDMDQIHAPQARAITQGKPSVIAGLFDSGVDITHPDLAGRVKASASASCVGGIANPAQHIWSNDVFGHGTSTSGLIGAAKNDVGIVGVAPGVTLAMVKVAVDDFNDPNVGQVFADAFVCAVDWAIGHNWDLINASLTIDPFTAPDDDTFCSDQPDRAAIVKIVRRAILEAARNKITMVAAAGNAFQDLANLDEIVSGTNCQQMPVQLPRVIGVSAVGVTRKLAFYSNYGFGAVDLTAPGGDGLIPNPVVTDTTASGQVLAPLPPESFFYQQAAGYDGQIQDCSIPSCPTYAYVQGTSASAPLVTGVAALAISRFGKMTPEQLLVRMSLAANPLPCPPSPYDPLPVGQPATCKGPAFYNNFYGAGEVDALATIR